MQGVEAYEHADDRDAAARTGFVRHRASWFTDPLGRHEIRYWDGRGWTAHVSDGGIPAIDPPDSAASASGALPVPRHVIAGAAGSDVLIPRGGARAPARPDSHRRLWPWLIAAATAVLLALIVTGTGGRADPGTPPVRVVHRVPATTATLPVSECQRIVLEVQAGIRTMSVADYRRACGALPAGVVLTPKAGATTAASAESVRWP